MPASPCYSLAAMCELTCCRPCNIKGLFGKRGTAYRNCNVTRPRPNAAGAQTARNKAALAVRGDTGFKCSQCGNKPQQEQGRLRHTVFAIRGAPRLRRGLFAAQRQTDVALVATVAASTSYLPPRAM